MGDHDACVLAVVKMSSRSVSLPFATITIDHRSGDSLFHAQARAGFPSARFHAPSDDLRLHALFTSSSAESTRARRCRFLDESIFRLTPSSMPQRATGIDSRTRGLLGL